MTRLIPAAVAATALLVAAAPAARADLTEWPTCSLPLSADQAYCEDGRSPNRLVTGPDGGIWFTTYGGEEVGRVSSGGALVMYDLPPVPGGPAFGLRNPYGITVGPDGALWYAEDAGNRIGRVTTSGAFTFFADPGARPQDVALGPDGALWITESGTNSIGRLTPSGVFTHIPLSPVAGLGNKLMRITAGPDGRMWFAELVARRIGAVTMSGKVTEYHLPTGWSPQSLVAGPDGAIWFTSFAKGVGRISTSGAVTTFGMPAAGAASITTGPDGALYVGEGRAAGVLRMTTGGLVTETPLLSGATINDITTGPDGAIWFVETAHNRIGRLGAGTSTGPVVTSISPAGGVPGGGTKVTVRGERLGGATRVLFGATPASAVDPVSSRQLVATAPAHAAGPVRIVVTAGGRTSPGTDAGLFTYADDLATITAPAPVVPAATVLTPAVPRLDGGTLVVPLSANGAAGWTLTVALAPRARVAVAGHVASVRRVARKSGRATRAGRSTVRIRLSPSARRAVAAARRGRRPIVVAVQATGADRRISVRQRSAVPR